MQELRVDPLTGLRSLVATERAERPGAAFDLHPPEPVDPATDPFAPGNEDRTPPEVLSVPSTDGAGWAVRVVPNLYPALTPDAEDPPAQAVRDLYTAFGARGAHEVVVNAPDAVTSLADLTPEQVALALDCWRDRIRHHRDAGASYVHVIVNEGREAGASRPHTHAQVFALGFVPAAVARERERFGAYATRTMGGNLLADLVQEEVRRRERLVAVDRDAVLLAPYASKLPYQLMVVPRRPIARFEDDGPTGAALLHDGLNRLRRALGGMPPLNIWVRTAPSGADHFCWRIDVLPRLTSLAGLELGAGVHVCTVAPEDAAAHLRDA